jgi:hypothetical protein
MGIELKREERLQRSLICSLKDMELKRRVANLEAGRNVDNNANSSLSRVSSSNRRSPRSVGSESDSAISRLPCCRQTIQEKILVGIGRESTERALGTSGRGFPRAVEEKAN